MLLIGCNGDRRAADSNPPEKPAPQRDSRLQAKRAAQAEASPREKAEDLATAGRPAETQPEQTLSASRPTPQPVYRPDDLRQQHDDARLAEAGIRVYESERLKLYTDIDAEIARTLPPLMDAVYLAWVEYFGELPAARDGSPFQLTGYVIRDESLFREAASSLRICRCLSMVVIDATSSGCASKSLITSVGICSSMKRLTAS